MDKAGTMVAGGVMLLILCVLPAGMSRSAWLAAGVSCLCVYAWHMDWTDKFRLLWQQQRQRVVMVVVGGFCVLLLAGYLLFVLKPICTWPSFHVEDNLSCHCRKAVDRIWDS